MIRIRCTTATSIGRFSLEDYVRHLRIEIMGFDEHGAEYLLGRVFADLVLWADAEMDEESLFAICDNDSQGLCDAFEIITDGTGTIRDDLEINEVLNNLLFIYGWILAPDIACYRQAVLEAVVGLFGTETLVVMWHMSEQFPEIELAQLGFRRISGQDLIFRHTALATEFLNKNPRGIDVDFTASPQQEKWVLQELQRKGYTEGDVDDL